MMQDEDSNWSSVGPTRSVVRKGIADRRHL